MAELAPRLVVLAVLAALASLTACQPPASVVVARPDDPTAATAPGKVRAAAEQIKMARTAAPHPDKALVYIFQGPEIPIYHDIIVFDGAVRQEISSGQFTIWELDPGDHLVETFDVYKKTAANVISVRAGDVLYYRYVDKRLRGGLGYILSVPGSVGRDALHNSNLGGYVGPMDPPPRAESAP